MVAHSKEPPYWREFEKNKVSHSAAHYLMAVDRLRKSLGYARLTDVAEELSVSRGATSMAVSQLKKRNLIAEDPNRFLLLTDEGQEMADEVEHNFATLSSFFGKILGVPHEVAMSDACKTEHLLSRETCRRLVRLMHYILSDEQRAGEYRSEMDFSDGETEFDESMGFSPVIDEELLKNDQSDSGE